MSSPSASSPPGGGAHEPNHARRFGLTWLVGTVIALPLVILLVGPLLAPDGSDQASLQRTDMTVLAGIATPVVVLVLTFLAYSIVHFRQQPGAMLEGPAVRGNARIQTLWIVITSVLVLGIAAFGTVELEVSYGAGSGSGPNPVTVPSGPKLPVQVIAQEWYFTYRYPTYGGIETYHLVLPVNKEVELHVTSLDVVHSFWAYKLGVKADATPDVDNIAFVKPTKIGSFTVRCAELCGLWHGAMHDTGRVVSASAFHAWVAEQKSRLAPSESALPKYSKTYVPEPLRRGE
jgi:cytochrome c oxidase subunit 2